MRRSMTDRSPSSERLQAAGQETGRWRRASCGSRGRPHRPVRRGGRAPRCAGQPVALVVSTRTMPDRQGHVPGARPVDADGDGVEELLRREGGQHVRGVGRRGVPKRRRAARWHRPGRRSARSPFSAEAELLEGVGLERMAAASSAGSAKMRWFRISTAQRKSPAATASRAGPAPIRAAHCGHVALAFSTGGCSQRCAGLPSYQPM